MIWLYRLLFFPALLLASPYYLRRMIRRGGYGANFAERFGRVPPLAPKTPTRKRLWIQAVSVGEMLAIGPLLQKLAEQKAFEVYLSTTTSTGYKLARERYAGLCLAIAYFPIDAWPFARRAWRRIQPDLVLLTEGERWPEHLHQAKCRNVPVLCVNARLSDRSFRRLRRAPTLARSLFQGITLWLPGSRQDEQRLLALGFPTQRVLFTGNLKFDFQAEALDANTMQTLREELGLTSPLLLLGASTWPGEEQALLRAWRQLREAGLKVDLLLVPRHAERREELRTWLEKQPFKVHFRSTGRAPQPVEVAVADTTGELRKLLQLGDLVWIGKSLPPHHEGQTPVEAAAFGRALFFGPRLSNFREIAESLLAQGAARRVADADGLVHTARELLTSPEARQLLANRAKAWHASNQGALQRTLEAIRQVL